MIEVRACPIKLVFNNIDDQQKVIRNIKNLKGKISIKEDCTFNKQLAVKKCKKRVRA